MIKGGINHITLTVRSLKKAKKFYQDILGLKLVGQRQGMDFYSSGLYNHELALIEDKNMSIKIAVNGGFAHVAFNVENKHSLKQLQQKLINSNISVSTGVNHTIAYSFYTRDFDGYMIEFTTDNEKDSWNNNSHDFQYDTTYSL